MSEVMLKLNGKRFQGWKEVRINRGMEQAAGAFNLSVTSRYPGQPDRWEIRKGDACQVFLDGELAVTGFVDRVGRHFGGGSSGIQVTGRDKAADIIDSAACRPGTTSATGDMGALTLTALAMQLCKPHGVAVKVAAGLDVGGPFSNVSINPGETVWKCIERYARQRAVLLMSDGTGDLIITRAGATRNPNALIEGVNIEYVDEEDDESKLFHTYVTLGQSGTTANFNGAAALHAHGTAVDDAVRKNRVQILTAEAVATGQTLNDRAAWERDVRRGRSRNLVITVSEFSARGRLWRPNEMVPVQIPRYGINKPMLIKSVDSAKDDQGSRTEITVVPKETYSLIREAPKPKSGSSTGGSPW